MSCGLRGTNQPIDAAIAIGDHKFANDSATAADNFVKPGRLRLSCEPSNARAAEHR
jgi:hypothetical protein